MSCRTGVTITNPAKDPPEDHLRRDGHHANFLCCRRDDGHQRGLQR
jgi:hypothetical protein